MKNLEIQNHYSKHDLYSEILQAMVDSGIERQNIKREDFSRTDEFHLMGDVGTKLLADSLSLTSDMKVLDLGCGIGGASRFIADTYKCKVVGVDLTWEYVETAKKITEKLGMGGLAFEQADATDLPFDDDTFDVVWTQHVQMNIEDKSTLLKEIKRVLKPGGQLAFFDIFSSDDSELRFPLPWAEDARISFTCSIPHYETLLKSSGYSKMKMVDLSNEAINWQETFFKKVKEEGVVPKLSPKLLMGKNMPTKLQNLLQSLKEGTCRVGLGVFEKS